MFRLNHVIVGKPFELSEFYDKKLDEETLQSADNLLAVKLKELREEHTAFLQAKKHKKK